MVHCLAARALSYLILYLAVACSFTRGDKLIDLVSEMTLAPEMKLVSSDKKEFFVRTEVACKWSGLLKYFDICGEEDIDTDDGSTDNLIPLPRVDAKELEMIIEYMTHHHDNEDSKLEIATPLKEGGLRASGVSEWDAKFIDKSIEDVNRLLTSAHYMLIESLVDLAAAKVAYMHTEPFRQGRCFD